MHSENGAQQFIDKFLSNPLTRSASDSNTQNNEDDGFLSDYEISVDLSYFKKLLGVIWLAYDYLGGDDME